MLNEREFFLWGKKMKKKKKKLEKKRVNKGFEREGGRERDGGSSATQASCLGKCHWM